MISAKEAYKIAYDIFVFNDCAGVGEMRDAGEYWLFSEKCDCPIYGAIEICVPKNGDEPFIINTFREPYAEKWRNAKKVCLLDVK